MFQAHFLTSALQGAADAVELSSDSLEFSLGVAVLPQLILEHTIVALDGLRQGLHHPAERGALAGAVDGDTLRKGCLWQQQHQNENDFLHSFFPVITAGEVTPPPFPA